MVVCSAFVSSMLVVFLVNLVALSNGHECYRQRCLNCSFIELSYIGSPVDCRSNNVFNPGWLEPEELRPHPLLDDLQFTCVKIEVPSRTADGQPHLVRSCVIGNLASSQTYCNDILIGHQAQELRMGKCHVCSGNLCNAAAARAPLLSLLAAIAVIKMAITMFS